MQWSSGRVAYWTQVQLSPGPLKATLSKLLTCCVLRPTQPPTLSEMGVAYLPWPWGEGLVWLIGVVAYLLAAPRVQLSVNVGSGWPYNALRYH